MLLVLLFACQEADGLLRAPTVPTPDAEQELLQRLLTGDPTAEHALAWSSGFPVPSGTNLAFVHRSNSVACAVSGAFNDWGGDPMERTGDLWHLEVRADRFIEEGRYQFLCDGILVADPLARSYTHDAFGEVSFATAPDIAHLERWPQLADARLASRDLTVWVPAAGQPFDVLYAADGQNLFDPRAPFGGWRMQEALLGRNVLVVGVHSTSDRLAEYTHVDDRVLDDDVVAMGDLYATFLRASVRPHVEASYPTSGRNGLLGSSLGGLISLHIAQSQAGDWDFAASLSGTLGWGRFKNANPTIEERWIAAPPPGVVVYADSGGGSGADGCTDPNGDGFPVDDPDSSDGYCETRQFVDALAANGATWDTDLFHWHEPDAPHNEAAWAARVHRPLQIFSP